MESPTSPSYEENMPAGTKQRMDGGLHYEDEDQAEILKAIEQLEADTQEADRQEADTQQAEDQCTTQKGLTPLPAGWTRNAYRAVPAGKNKKGVHKPAPDGLSGGVRRIQEVVARMDAGQECCHEIDSTLVAGSIPEQIRFFDIQFDNMAKEYKITRLREDVRNWHNLKAEFQFISQHETFRRGDLVHIKLHEQADIQQGDDMARIEDIRSLSSTDQRRLILVAWLYYLDGRFYDSNHLQIVLWDTITYRTSQSLAEQVHPRQLYNVCGGKKFCSDKQTQVWRNRKADVLSPDHMSSLDQVHGLG